ncbi:MAG: hypothetical protein U9R02_09055 [Thermodesulfobacteriota bacterium]|nr:hypothetical protein [Thermodesulfobacteriota bacterium]
MFQLIIHPDQLVVIYHRDSFFTIIIPLLIKIIQKFFCFCKRLYIIPLGENARKRHYHEADKGDIIGFAVQLEVLVNDQWKVVIRYDSAHGFAHIDRYYLDGRKVKIELHLKLSEALTLGDEDIKENWKIYQKAFLEGK